MTALHEALRIADALGSIEVTYYGMNVCDRASTELRRLHAENESLKAALTSGADALTQQGEQRCDTARVLEWMRTPNRKAAQFAFTEGPERHAAYWIEIAQGEPAAQPDTRKVIEQMVVALEIAERHLAYVEITEAKEAGQQWLEENK